MEPRSRLVGFNHVAVEVDDVDEALEFYGRIFDFELRGRDVQFTKIPEVLRGMGLDDLEKSPEATQELRKKGLVPEEVRDA